MRIGVVLGTRPEIMKNYAIVNALRASNVAHEVLYTNQHDSVSMKHSHFDQAGYWPTEVMPPAYHLGKAIDWLCQQIRALKITHILVNGDTATALAGALAALYTDTPLSHVEAGLRSFDLKMLEERNRIMIDAISHDLFTYTEFQTDYLQKNRELRGRIVNVGNTTVDLLHDFASQIQPLRRHRYAYITLHRKEFTDDPERMATTFATINQLTTSFDELIFPMHPRTRSCMAKHGLSAGLLSNVTILEPQPFVQSLAYEKYASLILTDSGCIQEEAYLFAVPCVTIRENTERVETVLHGANVISGFCPDDILAAVDQQLNKELNALPPIYGPLGAGERIVQALLNAA